MLLVFLAVTVLPAGGLVWLGWRLLEQDKALEAQRWVERRDRTADAVVAALEQHLSSVERQLADTKGWEALPGAEGAVSVEFGLRGVEAHPRNRLVYYPWLPNTPEPPDRLFAAGEEQEFRRRNYTGALALYQELAGSADPAVRVGALLRIARSLRKAGEAEQALAAYVQLAGLDNAFPGGIPSGLLARRARCALLDELNRREALRREALALYSDLRGARWQLTRAAYQVHIQDARDWAGGDPKSDARQEMLAAAVERLWQNWQSRPETDGPWKGREAIATAEGPVTTLWVQTGQRLRALAASPDYVEKQWMAPVQDAAAKSGMRAWLIDGNERHAREAAARATQRGLHDTGLPWTVVVSAIQPGAPLEELPGRRRLMLIGLALIGFLVLAGTYFIGRSVAKELAVARLQSEFVAAVSHEFRTPLTSLRQFTEILADHRVPEESRDPYYQALSRATQRLQRLVESLLNFGRMEAGAAVYRCEAINVAELVGSVVGEFRGEVKSRGYDVQLQVDGDATVSADREAITRALWNLLDNAVKYSPESRTVWVEVGREDGRVAIRVRDRGLGVAPEEQKEILGKFVRGSSSKRVEGKGTGIGLTMVHHIVRAHRGDLRLESRPGEGSTFTILLPVRS